MSSQTMATPVRSPKTQSVTSMSKSSAPSGAVGQSLASKVATHAFLILGALISLFPFYWLVAMSTNQTSDIYRFPPKFTFGTHFAENYANLVKTIDLYGSILNTLIVAVLSALLVMFFDSLAAFTFAKYRFPGKNALFLVLLITFLIPGQLSLVPSFVLMSWLGWVGTLKALIIPGAANAFGIFLLRQMAEGSIPDELIESARMDGAGFFRTYLNVGIPMLRGGLAFLGIFTFIGQWNDYVWPLIVLINPHQQTLQVALSQLNSIYGTDFGMVMAGALIAVVPLIVLFVSGSRFFIANISAGAVKG